MEKFQTIISNAVPLPIEEVDTDQIIPARFLKATTREGFGDNLFRDWRFNADNSPKEDFVLNNPTYSGTILVAGKNFGCGSSREHAAWALIDMGVKVVIAPSFSDIFSGNAFKNGILTVALPQEAIDRLLEVAKTDPIHVDLEAQSVTTSFQDRFQFEIDPFRKSCLLGGLDEIGLTLSSTASIDAYEKDRESQQPWLTPELA